MNDNAFKKILLDEEEIQKIVLEVANQIKKKHQGEKIFLLGILNGAFIFMSDLIRKLYPRCDLEIAFMKISSYGLSSKSSGKPQIILDISREAIQGKKVILVEDIVDTGITLNFLVEYLKSKGAQSIEICAFLDKSGAREVELNVDYFGKKVPNEFLVGYGLDWAEKFRNLPFVAILKKEIYS